MSDGSIKTCTYEFHQGRWVAVSGIIENRRDLVFSSFGGVLYVRRYVPIGAE